MGSKEVWEFFVSQIKVGAISDLCGHRPRLFEWPVRPRPRSYMEYSTLQGIGLSGSYWYENVHNVFKENPRRVIHGIANLAYIDNEAWYK